MDILVLVFLFVLALVSQVAGLYTTPMLGFAAAAWAIFAMTLIVYYGSVESVYLSVLFIGLAVFNAYMVVVNALKWKEEKW